MPNRSPHDSNDPTKDSHVVAHQLLAVAVLRCAVSDATRRTGSAEDRNDAMRFLRGEDGELGFWLSVLGADERQARELIGRLVDGERLVQREWRGGRKERKHLDSIGETTDEAW